MLALAWKTYRQTRLVAAMVMGLLMLMYLAAWLSPWSPYRAGVVMIGIPVLVTLLGGMAFSEERRTGSDRFLRTLPVPPFRRWLAGAATNALITTLAAAVVFLLAVLFVGTREANIVGDMTEHLGALSLMLLALWTVSVFWSSIVSGGISAMLLALATAGAAAGLVSFVAETRSRAFQDSLLLDNVREGFAYLVLALLAATFLAGSYAFERKGVRDMRPARRAAGAAAVLAIATLLAAGVFICAVVDGSVAKWRNMGDVVLAVGDVEPDGSLLVARGDYPSSRLLKRDSEGRWRRYAARLGAFTRLAHGTSPDGTTLAFTESQYAETPWEIAFETTRILALGGRTRRTYDYSAQPTRFLDLQTGEVIAPALPVAPRVNVWPLGWREKPTRFIAVADRLEEDSEQVVQTVLYVVAPDGSLLEKRDLPQFAAFRSADEHVRTRHHGTWMLQRGPINRTGSKIVSVKVKDNRKEPLSDYEVYGSYMIYDMDSGATDERRIKDHETHLAFSPTLAWELKLEGGKEAEYDLNSGGSSSLWYHNRGWVRFERIGDDEPPHDRPPALLLTGDKGDVTLCNFAEGVRSVDLNFSFLRDESLLFAMVVETAPKGTPDFEHVVLDLPADPESRPYNWGFRRVRAITIDTHTLDRRELTLPPVFSEYVADPPGYHVIFHNAFYDATAKRSRTCDALLLRLPELDQEQSFHWTEGNGPNLSYADWRTAFLPDGDIVTLSRQDRDVLAWNPRSNTLRTFDVPALSDLPLEKN